MEKEVFDYQENKTFELLNKEPRLPIVKTFELLNNLNDNEKIVAHKLFLAYAIGLHAKKEKKFRKIFYQQKNKLLRSIIDSEEERSLVTIDYLFSKIPMLVSRCPSCLKKEEKDKGKINICGKCETIEGGRDVLRIYFKKEPFEINLFLGKGEFSEDQLNYVTSRIERTRSVSESFQPTSKRTPSHKICNNLDLQSLAKMSTIIFSEIEESKEKKTSKKPTKAKREQKRTIVRDKAQTAII